jgi:hypothetical protein
MNESKKTNCGDRCYKPCSTPHSTEKKAKKSKGNIVFMDSPMATWSRRNEI